MSQGQHRAQFGAHTLSDALKIITSFRLLSLCFRFVFAVSGSAGVNIFQVLGFLSRREILSGEGLLGQPLRTVLLLLKPIAKLPSEKMVLIIPPAAVLLIRCV